MKIHIISLLFLLINFNLFSQYSTREAIFAETLGESASLIIQLIDALVQPKARKIFTKGFQSKTLDSFNPRIGLDTLAELGESVLKRSLTHYKKGAILKDSLNINLMGAKAGIPPCPLIFVSEEKKFLLFMSFTNNFYQKSGMKFGKNAFEYLPVLMVNKENGYVEKLTFYGGDNSSELQINVKNENQLKLTACDLMATDLNNFERELIYNGKAGDIIKIIYREFTDDMARPDFTQELQYDLKDGNVIGFKGARIEVIKATNMNLEYKLLSSFRD